jgi:transcriptional antiterminator RfaH
MPEPLQKICAQPYRVWHAVASRPHRETFAIENLERQGFKAYCPLITKRIRHARRAYDAPRPLFPGYIFVEGQETVAYWRPLTGTFGVRSVVMSGEKPAQLPPGFIESLKAREVDGVIQLPETRFEIGQKVTIRGGVFDGLIAQIIGLRDSGRVMVLLDLLRQQTRINVDKRQLV